MPTPIGSRPDIHTYFLRMARLVATRSTCARRSVGCVIVDARNYVMATGYNGTASGAPHCTDTPCPGAKLPSGEGLHVCHAVHAEASALIQCHDISRIHSIYCTSSPCIHCMRFLCNTSVRAIYFEEQYPHTESEQMASERGIAWIHLPNIDQSGVQG